MGDVLVRSPKGGADMLGLKGGWIVRSHVGWGGERNIVCKGVDTSP